MGAFESGIQVATSGMRGSEAKAAEKVASLDRRLDRLERSKMGRLQGAYTSYLALARTNSTPLEIASVAIDVQAGQCVGVVVSADIYRTAPATVATASVKLTGPSSSTSYNILSTTNTGPTSLRSCPGLTTGVAGALGTTPGGLVVWDPTTMVTVGAGACTVKLMLVSDSATANTASMQGAYVRVLVL